MLYYIELTQFCDLHVFEMVFGIAQILTNRICFLFDDEWSKTKIQKDYLSHWRGCPRSSGMLDHDPANQRIQIPIT